MKTRKRSRQQTLSAPAAESLAAPPTDDLSSRKVLRPCWTKRCSGCPRVIAASSSSAASTNAAAEVAQALGLKEGTISKSTGPRTASNCASGSPSAGSPLSAVLSVAAAGRRTASRRAVVRTTARAAARLAAGESAAGGVPAHVLSLARGKVTQNHDEYTGPNRLVAAVVRRSARRRGLGPADAGDGPAAEGAAKDRRAAGKAEDKNPASVSRGESWTPKAGRSRGRSYSWPPHRRGAKGTPSVAVTGAAGKFEIALSPAERERDVLLVAMAAGLAPDWVSLHDLKGKKDVTLRLVKNDRPLSGRLLDLEGRPLANVTVDVRWVGKAKNGDVGKWIDHFLAMNKKGYWINEDDCSSADRRPSECRPWPLPIRTAASR